MKVHCWTKTPYEHMNPFVWANCQLSPLTEAESAGRQLRAKPPGNRVLFLNSSLTDAFDVSDPVRFYGTGPFISSDLAWSRTFFNGLKKLGADVDRIVFDRESATTLFAVENQHGVAGIVAIIQTLRADPACQHRFPESVTRWRADDFDVTDPNRIAAYNDFNAWAHERYYLQAFRDAFLTPAREALGDHVRASEYDTTLVIPGFTEPGGEWPHLSGTVGGTSSPVMYLSSHRALPTIDARRDYRLARLKSAIDAAKLAGEDVLPWISGVSFDLAAEQAGNGNAYTLDPMYGVDYVRRMIALGVKEFLYWNPSTPYRDERTILRDDAMMAVLAGE